MDLMKFLTEETLMIVATLWVFGMILKAIPGIPNWKIPFFLLALGIILSFGLLFVPIVTNTIMQGALAAGSAVFIHGALKKKSTNKQTKSQSVDTVKSVDNVADDKNI